MPPSSADSSPKNTPSPPAKPASKMSAKPSSKEAADAKGKKSKDDSSIPAGSQWHPINVQIEVSRPPGVIFSGLIRSCHCVDDDPHYQ